MAVRESERQSKKKSVKKIVEVDRSFGQNFVHQLISLEKGSPHPQTLILRALIYLSFSVKLF